MRPLTSRPGPLAPKLSLSGWLNTEDTPSIAALRGRVVLLHFFQMLCPGCVSHAIPQTEKLFRTLQDPRLVVLGVHSVFEHHDVMTPDALRAFVHEYRLTFPIGIDRRDGSDPIPRTMRDYALQGTPSTVLIGADGHIRMHAFGRVDDLALGAAVGEALALAEQPLK